MSLIKKIILVLLFVLPTSNSWGIISDEVQNAIFADNNDAQRIIRGLAFNSDGSKVFLNYQNPKTTNQTHDVMLSNKTKRTCNTKCKTTSAQHIMLQCSN